jgi:hypothetical protein
MPTPIKHQLFVGDPEFPTIFTLEETHSRLEGWVDYSLPTVFHVRVERPNDLDFYDPIIEFEQEFQHYGTALVVFSTQLQEHANFVSDYEAVRPS